MLVVFRTEENFYKLAKCNKLDVECGWNGNIPYEKVFLQPKFRPDLIPIDFQRLTVLFHRFDLFSAVRCLL